MEGLVLTTRGFKLATFFCFYFVLLVTCAADGEDANSLTRSPILRQRGQGRQRTTATSAPVTTAASLPSADDEEEWLRSLGVIIDTPDDVTVTTTTTTRRPPPRRVDVTTPDPCYMRSTCLDVGSRSSNMTLGGASFAERNCFCDLQCDTYGDCCSNVLGDKGQQPVTLTLSCAIYQEIDSADIYIVTSCPDNFEDDLTRSECGKFDTDMGIYRWPVSRQSDGLIYANVFCAKCNGVNDPVFWNAEVQCKTSVSTNRDNVTGVYDAITSSRGLHRNCRSEYKHSLFKPRYCKPAISTCSGKSKKVNRNKCLSTPTSYVYSGESVYKNKYCALCNQVKETEYFCADEKLYPVVFHLLQATFANPSRGPGTFALLLDLNSGQGQLEERVGTAGVQYKTETVLDTRQCDADEVFDPFVRICRRLTCSGPYRYDAGKQACVLAVIDEGDRVRSQYMDNAKVADNTSVSSISLSASCPTMITLNSSEFKMLVNGSLYHTARRQVLFPGDFHLHSDNQLADVCVDYQRNYTEERNVTITIVMFKFDDNVQHIMSTVGLIISLTAMAILIFIYLWKPALRNLPGKIMLSLISSLFIAQLLFLVGLSRTEHHYVCLACAASMHFAFLAAFFWMNVMAFDLCRTFSADGYKSADSNKSFIKYSVYAWLCPALIVTSSVVIDVLRIDPINLVINFLGLNTEVDIKPNYVNDYVCWISNRTALLTWFATPLALIMGANLVLYVITIRNIYVISKMSRPAVADQPSRGQFLLFVKLSLVMGLTWLFGFLAAIFDVFVLWYMFIVFNTLQGALLALMFLCTKKVCRLLRSSGHRKPTRLSTNGTLGSSSSDAATRRTYVPLSTSSKHCVRETTI